VYGVELNQEILDSCKKGKAHFYEPGVDVLLRDYLGSKLFVSSDVPDKTYDYIVISVGTPLVDGDKHANLDYLKRALESIRPVLRKNSHVILRSTVSVGTTKAIVAPFMKEVLGVGDDDILLSFCPERTVEGKALEELQTLPQLTASYNEKSRQSATAMFSRVSPEVHSCPTIEAAELAKLFNNVHRDINFAIGNLFSRIAQSYGINGNDMIALANKGYERSAIASPGFVGGACLEKDAYILASNVQLEGEKLQILSHRQYNEDLVTDVADWVKENVAKGGKLLLSGMAFKGRPKTSDLRGSLAVQIVNLLKADYQITVHDHCAYTKDMERIGGVTVAEALPDGDGPFDLFMILNNAEEYSSLSAKDVQTVFPNDRTTVFDSWNVLPKEFQQQYTCVTLGDYRIGS
jgi:UDP-N-acetyl-D-mannosaminuronic acid dehydrogenase